MADLSPYISIIPLNVNGLNGPIKRQSWQNRFFLKTQLYAVNKKLTLNMIKAS